MAGIAAAAQNAHNVFGMRHLQPVHHMEHPKARKDAFDRLYGERGKLEEKIARREMLSPIESLHRMLEGNRSHVRRVERFFSVDGGRMPGEIKCMLLMCADARLGGMLGFDDFAKEGIAPIYVAGNVAEVFKGGEMKSLLGKLAKESSIIIMGHSKCGAVHCAKEAEKFSHEKHGNMRQLLACVHHEDEGENVLAQAAKLRKSDEYRQASGGKSIRIACAFADIAGEKPSVGIIGKSGIGQLAIAQRISRQFEDANRGQDLSQKQYAHAIVISDPKYRFDGREMASCGANEVFCISAASADGKAIASAEMALGGLLDAHAIASAEYSITHNNTRHIAIVHGQYEKIEAQMIADSQIIREAVVRGEVEITAMQYDPKSGVLTPLRHLVNQDVQGTSV